MATSKHIMDYHYSHIKETSVLNEGLLGRHALGTPGRTLIFVDTVIGYGKIMTLTYTLEVKHS